MLSFSTQGTGTQSSASKIKLTFISKGKQTSKQSILKKGMKIKWKKNTVSPTNLYQAASQINN